VRRDEYAVRRRRWCNIRRCFAEANTFSIHLFRHRPTSDARQPYPPASVSTRAVAGAFAAQTFHSDTPCRTAIRAYAMPLYPYFMLAMRRRPAPPDARWRDVAVRGAGGVKAATRSSQLVVHAPAQLLLSDHAQQRQTRCCCAASMRH